jgi:hypothetical protein
VADPFAPPSDTPRTPRRRAPNEAPPAYEPEPSRREVRETRDPAHPGIFWVVAAIGIALICLGSLVSFFGYMGDLDGEDVAPAVFVVFGTIALALGLALAAVLQRGLSMGVRVALLLGAGYFAASGSGFGLLAMLCGNPFF